MRFDGKKDFIVIEKEVSGGMNALAITMWVKGEWKKGGLVLGAAVLNFDRDSGFFLRGRDGKGSGYLTWDRDITQSAGWRHLAAVWSGPGAADGGKMKLHMDGIRQQNDRSFSGAMRDGGMRICAAFNQYMGGFQGEMEDFRVYNRALSESEILSIYLGEEDGKIMEGLVLWYPMKNRELELAGGENGRIIQDGSGRGNHGRVNGSPVWNVVGGGREDGERRKKINATREWIGRKKMECDEMRRFLAERFEKRTEKEGNWVARFESLNRRFDAVRTGAACCATDLLHGYYDLWAEVVMADLTGEVIGKTGKKQD